MKRTSEDMRRTLVAGALMALCLLWAASGFAQGPSFDCSKPKTPVERMICKNPGLSQLDNHLADVYRELLNNFPKSHRKELVQNQRKWLKSREWEEGGRT